MLSCQEEEEEEEEEEHLIKENPLTEVLPWQNIVTFCGGVMEDHRMRLLLVSVFFFLIWG